MAEYQVNIAELQEICDYVINADYPYFEELREAFKLLRHTGCREMEIFEIQRWSQVSGDEFTLTPQKGNNNRTIILGEDFTNFKAAILGQYPPFLGRTYSQLQNLFKRVCPYWPIYSGGKQITLYTFRYLFLHELKADGLTNQQIANIMGHVNVETVSNYLDAILTSTNEVPVVQSIDIAGQSYNYVDVEGLKIITRNLYIDFPGIQAISVDNNPANDLIYGKMYHKDDMAVISNLLPSGWKLSTRADWEHFSNIPPGNVPRNNYYYGNEPLAWPNGPHSNIFGTSFLPTGFYHNSAHYQKNLSFVLGMADALTSSRWYHVSAGPTASWFPTTNYYHPALTYYPLRITSV